MEAPLQNLPLSFWKLAFDQLNVAIGVKNPDGVISHVNQKLADFLGLRPEDIIGKTVESVLSKENYEAQKALLEKEREKRLRGEASVYEIQIALPGRAERTLRIHSSPIFDEKKNFLGSVAIVTDASEEKSAMKSASDAQALLKAVYESAEIGMCVTDATGKFVEVNPAYCRAYGYSRDELIGQHFTIVLPDHLKDYARKLHDDYIAAGTDDSAGEWQVQCKDGSIRDILVTAARLVLNDGRRFKVTTVTDITERKAIERQLRYQANLLQNVSDAIIATDKAFKITSWNKAAEKIYGWKELEVIGKRIGDVLNTWFCNGETTENALKILMEKGEWLGEVAQTRKDGTEIVVEASVSLLRDAKGEPIGVVAINRDITRQKAMEEERKQLYEQLQQLQKMEAIGTLTGGVAHDFNNILSVILGNANSILEKTTDEKLRRYAERIKSAGERAANLTKQLLGFARKGKLQVAPVDLLACVQDIVAILEHTADRRIRIVIESEARLPKVAGDKTQLEQVILNVAVNAIDAIVPTLDEKQTGTLRFRLRTERLNERDAMKLGLLANHDYVRLSVSDTGVGIPKEIQKRIFEPFFTTKEVGKGTGLGMAMVYGIARNHRGAVCFESEVGKGTTMEIYLPVMTSESDAPTRREPQKASAEKSVLVADDEEMIRELLAERLSEAGYAVYEAGDGSEAIEVLTSAYARQERIDAVVLDMNMPKMSGAKAFAEIRELFPSIIVLIATGYAQDETVQKMLESGLNAVIQKPYDPSELIAKLDELIERRDAR
ncbi:MAG: PAS domain S-box protein [Chloroherpetonaceae bacterium]|nr:PAS domain S-box protein [Chloroherpetonaceae bacterium]